MDRDEWTAIRADNNRAAVIANDGDVGCDYTSTRDAKDSYAIEDPAVSVSI